MSKEALILELDPQLVLRTIFIISIRPIHLFILDSKEKHLNDVEPIAKWPPSIECLQYRKQPFVLGDHDVTGSRRYGMAYASSVLDASEPYPIHVTCQVAHCGPG